MAKSTRAFSDEEMAAMRSRVAEEKAEARRSSQADKAAEEEADCLAKIAALKEPDRKLAERFHALVKASAPDLAPKTWYGMPAYAKDGDLICHFQPAEKFKTRYATIGFSDKAKLDDGAVWPVSYALTKLTAAEEKKIAELVRQAAG